MNILELKNITKKYGATTALDNLSIAFRAGRISGVTGPNGSGKSTMFNIISGRQNTDEGEIFLNRKKIPYLNIESANICGIIYVFQEPKLFDQISVLDNILAPKMIKPIFAAMREMNYDRHIQSICPILKKMGLWDKRNELASNLSYGQRKLLQLSRAVASNASIILLDEPFAGLFSETKQIIKQIIIELKKQNKTIILIEHNQKILQDLCDKIFLLNNGHLVNCEKPEKIWGKLL
ncbi:MAG: ATP-binding cassette domain-containing protein [Candidatus Magasanikbacteria bacterium]|jgi:ABC-type branched-subunit amino acid transport system ATPase component